MLISYIDIDKFVAAPVSTDSVNPVFPESDTQYYLVKVQVYDDQGNKAKGPTDVYFGDDQIKNRVQYWDEDKVNITQTVLAGTALHTDVHGAITIYVSINNFAVGAYPGCIFNVFASPTPGPQMSGINQTLTCCYFTFEEALAVADTNLDPIVLPTDSEHKVTIPHWNQFQYSTTVMLNKLSSDVSSNAMVSIIINGKRVDNLSYKYSDLQTGVEIPYHLMAEGPGKNNCMLYITDEGGNPKSSVPWQFPISGVPLLMPDPGAEGSPIKPSWWGAKVYGDPPDGQPLTLDDLADSNDAVGFDVELKIDPAANIGDVYRIYLYQNGYKDDVPHTLLIGDGGPIPGVDDASNLLTFTVNTVDWKAGTTVTICAPKEWSQGFAYRDQDNPGYLWVNYQVNGVTFSGTYPGISNPIKINFGTSSSTTGETKGRISEDTGSDPSSGS